MKNMVSVLEVAQYILNKTGAITSMKLQKLVYYSQAWHLVYFEKPLFNEKIEAWANGPVVCTLFAKHKGKFILDTLNQEIKNLTAESRELIDIVIKTYGEKTALWLSDLTHSESPWINARKGVPEGANSKKEISQQDIYDYFISQKNEQKAKD